MTDKNLSKHLGQAINDYGMIQDKDKIVIGLSGGMDSLAMLFLLHSRMQRIPITYELYPAFVDNFNGENPEHRKRIERLAQCVMKHTGLETHVIPITAVNKLTDGSTKKRDTCYLCAQKRRGELIKYALEKGCNKIALGHHKDDIIETTLMNLFYKRELSSMLPRLALFDGKLEIIRPLAYLEKRHIEDYIYNREEELPIFGEVCPAKMLRKDLRRLKIRKMVTDLSAEVPQLKNNLFASFRNPKKDYLLDQFFDPKSTGRFKRP